MALRIIAAEEQLRMLKYQRARLRRAIAGGRPSADAAQHQALHICIVYGVIQYLVKNAVLYTSDREIPPYIHYT